MADYKKQKNEMLSDLIKKTGLFPSQIGKNQVGIKETTCTESYSQFEKGKKGKYAGNNKRGLKVT